MPCGIPCRVGYVAVWDTLPCGIRCRVGYHAAGSHAISVRWMPCHARVLCCMGDHVVQLTSSRNEVRSSVHSSINLTSRPFQFMRCGGDAAAERLSSGAVIAPLSLTSAGQSIAHRAAVAAAVRAVRLVVCRASRTAPPRSTAHAARPVAQPPRRNTASAQPNVRVRSDSSSVASSGLTVGSAPAPVSTVCRPIESGPLCDLLPALAVRGRWSCWHKSRCTVHRYREPLRPCGVCCTGCTCARRA